MSRTSINVGRVLSLGAVLLAVSLETPMWWIAAVPWFVLNILGLLCVLPLFLLAASFLAGGAQADWMSDTFIITLVFIAPTIVSLLISIVGIPRWHRSELPSSADPRD